MCWKMVGGCRNHVGTGTGWVLALLVGTGNAVECREADREPCPCPEVIPGAQCHVAGYRHSYVHIPVHSIMTTSVTNNGVPVHVGGQKILMVVTVVTIRES